MHERRKTGGALSVRPGISGLAQINGRDMLSDEKKAALDIEYVSRMSLGSDFAILAKTVAHVIIGKGISSGEKDFKEIKEADR